MRTLCLLLPISLLLLTACADGELTIIEPEGAGVASQPPPKGGEDPGGAPAPPGTPGGNPGGDGDQCNQPLVPEDQVFTRAMCLCGDLGDIGQGLRTRSWSRTWGRDEGQGHVGINGTADIVGYANVEGELDIGQDLKGLGKVTTQGDLRTGNNFGGVGSYIALGNAYINGNLGGAGFVKIFGDLYINGQVQTFGEVAYDRLAGAFSYASQDPCACDSDAIIDVPFKVRSHQNVNNNSNLPVGGVGASEARLSSGAYYFASADQLIGSARLIIDGRVSIYLEDDLDAIGNLNIELMENAELELWVSGSVRSVGNLRFAREADARARAFKLYVGGQNATIVNVGLGRFYGGIYAPNADLEFAGAVKVYGSLFARNVKGIGSIDVYYDTDITVPDGCVDQWPDPVDEIDFDCTQDADCGPGQTCDELNRECIDEADCNHDNDCLGNDRCIQGQCAVL